MKSTILAATLLAALLGPATAGTPLPPPKPADCSGLAQARAQARSIAAPLGYDVFDLDGDNAHAFLKTQDVPERDWTDHLTVIVNRKTGRAAALTSDGPACAFGHGYPVLSPPYATPMDAAIDYLRPAR